VLSQHHAHAGPPVHAVAIARPPLTLTRLSPLTFQAFFDYTNPEEDWGLVRFYRIGGSERFLAGLLL
jgi:hypothetical protein